jgi:hypothetical protein
MNIPYGCKTQSNTRSHHARIARHSDGGFLPGRNRLRLKNAIHMSCLTVPGSYGSTDSSLRGDFSSEEVSSWEPNLPLTAIDLSLFG